MSAQPQSSPLLGAPGHSNPGATNPGQTSPPNKNRITRVLDQLSNACEGVSMLALVSVAAVQLWQVLARYLFNQSLAWSEPLSILLLSLVMSFATASAIHNARHFRFGWLADQAPSGVRINLARFTAALLTITCASLSIKCGYWAFDGMRIKLAGIAMPEGILYMPLAIAMLLGSIFACAGFFQAAHETATSGRK